MLFLSKEDIQACFSMRDAIDACKQALALYSEGKTSIPLRTNIDIANQDGQSLYMPGYIENEKGTDALGVKIVSVYPNNIDKNLPSVPATMVVIDAETGIVKAMMDGTYLTQLRTGAVQGAATELMSVEGAEVAALIGTGGQAEGQLWAMLTARDSIKEVRIFDIDFNRASEFSKEMTKKYGVTMIPSQSPEECVAGADIITTVTTSKRPTFEKDWIKPGAHINGVGAYTPEMAEIPRELIKDADTVIFDTVAGVKEESGDFIQPFNDGYLNESDYNNELGQLVLNQIIGRQSSDDITIFKTVGSAVLDVFVAQQIVEKAEDGGLGINI